MEMSSHNSSTKSSFYEEGPSDLVQKLTAAIQAGENDKATELVAELTSRKLKLDIAVPKEDNEIRAKENEFSVKVHVEDRESKGCIINMMVKSCDTVGDLKRKMMLQHDFPLEVQRWIIGKRISNDKEKLSHCGVKEAGHTLYLYLVTARSVGLTRQQYDLHKQAALQGVPISGQSLFHRESSSDQSMWNLHLDGQLQCFNGTAVNTHSTSSALNMADLSQGQPSPVAVSTSPGSRHSVSGGSLKLQEMLASVPASQALSSSSGLAFDPSEDDLSPAVSPLVMAGPRWSRASRSPSPGPSSPKETQSIEQVGWKCPRCTLINLPMRPGCELCSGSRPSDYHVPDGYQPTAEEMKLMENDQRLERLTREAPDGTENSAAFAPRKQSANEVRGMNTEQLTETLLLHRALLQEARGAEAEVCNAGQAQEKHVKAPPPRPPPPETSSQRVQMFSTTPGRDWERRAVQGGAQRLSLGGNNSTNLPLFDQLCTSHNSEKASQSDEEN
ncbi:ranBP-type and C3HC4-type zinc finger-containing protein 1 isoform X2 [Aplysia californica]|uniref:RanBP-type and C3HC4-type zinc finger-containing protein 1 isoform X2 n=1 Tax=Aplysia californica TaxID=6500 RepID=A0ABM1VS12_APLCA|nr:ranBP-type and C3HC4-type zinc finger-containing protein 1 isoform X2 [Aplysia californica]